MRYLVFDSETTGVPRRGMPIDDPAYPRVVELAGVLIDETGVELASFGFMVRPDGWAVMPEEAQRAHGISYELATTLGVPGRLALAALTNLSRVADRVVGHNVEFDLNIVRSELHRAGVPREALNSSYVCTAELGTSIVQLPPTERMRAAGFGNNFKKPTLSELHQFLFNESIENAHRALADVRACARCFIELRRLSAEAAT